MAIHTTKETTMFHRTEGVQIHHWDTNEQLNEFLKKMTVGEFGWIRNPYPDGYISASHFRITEDGPTLTNATWSPGDQENLIRNVGYENAKLLLGDRLIVAE